MATWSGLWNGQFNQTYSPITGNNTVDYNSTKQHRLAQIFKGTNGRKIGAILRAITGAPVGATATSTTPRVAASPAPGQAYSGGGKVTITQVTDLNRATNAADEAWFDESTLISSAPPVYPKDKSGAGGAKTPGFF